VPESDPAERPNRRRLRTRRRRRRGSRYWDSLSRPRTLSTPLATAESIPTTGAAAAKNHRQGSPAEARRGARAYHKGRDECAHGVRRMKSSSFNSYPEQSLDIPLLVPCTRSILAVSWGEILKPAVKSSTNSFKASHIRYCTVLNEELSSFFYTSAQLLFATPDDEMRIPLN
jgi:hypothetical protein